MTILIIILVVIIAFRVLLAYGNYAATKERKNRIYQKYGYTDIAEKIINKAIWVGETNEQLLDSFGQPLDIDENVLKTNKERNMEVLPKGY